MNAPVNAQKTPTESGLFLGLAYLFAALCAILLVAARWNPDDWLNLAEYGLFQNLQMTVLAAALALNIFAVVRSRGQQRVFWVALMGISFFYFWRESDFDKEFLGYRAFSWNYLDSDSLSTGMKALLAGSSMALLAGWTGYLVWRIRLLGPAIRERLQPAAVFWGGLHLPLLLAAQLWDKATMVQRHLQVNMHGSGKDPYAEEALELLGETAFLFFIVTLLRTTPAASGEKWRSLYAWLLNDQGRPLRWAVGGLLLAMGCAASGWSLYETLTFTPSAYEYVLTLDRTASTSPVEITTGSLTAGRIALLCVLLLAGTLAAPTGWAFLRGKGYGGRLAAVGVAVAAVLATLPAFTLQPTRERAVLFQVRTGEFDARWTEEFLMPGAALQTLDPMLVKRVKLDRPDLFREVAVFSRPDGFDLQMTFGPKADYRQRNTTIEFYVQYIDWLLYAHGLKPGRHDVTSADAAHLDLPESIWGVWHERWWKTMQERRLPALTGRDEPDDADDLDEDYPAIQ